MFVLNSLSLWERVGVGWGPSPYLIPRPFSQRRRENSRQTNVDVTGQTSVPCEDSHRAAGKGCAQFAWKQPRLHG